MKGSVAPVVWKGVGIRARGWSVYIGGRLSSAKRGFWGLGSAAAVAILGFGEVWVTTANRRSGGGDWGMVWR